MHLYSKIQNSTDTIMQKTNYLKNEYIQPFQHPIGEAVQHTEEGKQGMFLSIHCKCH